MELVQGPPEKGETITPRGGASIKVKGHPHRDDPTACSVETLTLGNASTLERYQQLSGAKSPNPETFELTAISSPKIPSGSYA